MNSPWAGDGGCFGRVLIVSTLLCLFVLAAAIKAPAQEDDPTGSAPPPELILSRSEKEKLAAAKDLRARTKLVIELMDIRLKDAELHSRNSDFEAVFAQLGPFHALAVNGIEHLEKQDTRSRSVLDNLKRFEIGIRGFLPRLELIRRNAAPEYEPYIRRLLRVLREARSRALDPMLSDTVVPTRRPD